ncbi:MAG TPA: SPOR domain-containing protein [Tenuifilaceae bacterium]|jgi:hypothetical protein|nr:SPOR domain-containing protein [Bacteroidales bacterium]MDI9516545.1 SPOR domain-containing protein [Bacteroidota bacterium]NLH55853.1 tetratricopeptide repeat protein [Rikenellaceae bacterium]OQC61837.1 MAG: hypothetical protein BWX49_02071 [Bacteroidetes bacterium ADurb.Bin008]HNV80547.1 SPOR domain-containing protein [Tenuifilaceae bacterium]
MAYFIRRSIVCILLAVLTLISGFVSGQDPEPQVKKSPYEVKADSLFQKKGFNEALPYYKQLVEQFSQDPNFHYRLGVCYLLVSKELDKSIEHLKFASTRQVSNMVYYYLGEAFFHSYNFDDAISYYRRFIINGGDPAIDIQIIEKRVGQCENGNFMVRFIYQPSVIDRVTVHRNDFFRYINTKSPKGSFILKPNDLKTSVDVKQGDNSIIFYPNNPEPGDRIFYSSYGSTTSFGKDIFVIEYQPDGFWSKPRNLGDVVNSSLDEDFPYMADDGVTLYFASKGHYSMGGFDIYRTIYNPDTKQWSTPENLGFPLSSPYDDFLFVPDENNEKATFVTARNTLADSLEVVLMEIDENPIRRPYDKIESLRRIAQLNSKEEPKKDLPKQVEQVGSAQHKPATFNAVENDPEYSRALAQGFSQQMKADSLRVKLDALRHGFEYVNTAEERRNLEKKVVIVENALLEAQQSADNFFVKASQIEQEYITGKRKPIDKPTSTFASDNPKFLYQAQFAPTVFQADEITRLAQLEKLNPQIEALRKELMEAKSRVQEIENSEPESYNENPLYQKNKLDYISKLRSINPLLTNLTSGKKELYRECVSVAVVKRGSNNDADIKSDIDRANQHFRAASAIRNNADDEGMDESTYEALLLDELGVLRLELVFAKLWGMRIYQQEVLSKIFRMEQNIFGRPLPTASPKIKTEKVEEPDKATQQQALAITRDNDKAQPDAILFHTDSEVEFQVVEKSPYSKTNPIPVDKPFPNGVIYRIQVAAFSNPVAIDFFKGMVPIHGELVNGGKVTKYYVGNFRMLSNAEKALPIVRSKGFKDAFIVAWHNGRTIALSRAKTLEYSQGPDQQEESPTISIEKDNRLYMIQLGHFKGRLPDDMTQTIKALAPGKDIIRKPDNQGGFIYSVGSYSDAVEATRVKDNLIGSGIKNAFVVAVEMDN